MNDYRQLSELYHYGIKDMKWGRRRYQNPDGSLTPEGRARYGYKDDVNDTDGSFGKLSREERTRKANMAVATDYQNISKGAKGGTQAAQAAANIARRGQERERARAKAQIDLSGMSDDEIRQKVNRMNLERQYKDLATADVGAGKAYASDVLSTVGDVVTIAGGIATIAGTIYMIKNG